MKRVLLFIGLSLFSFSIFSQDLTCFFNKADVFFTANVSNGRVAYSKIHENQKTLNEVLDLAKNSVISMEDKESYKAFWINAYNLSVIKGIVEHYPTKSPLDHSGFFDKTTHALGGKNITLNDIEHKLLRAEFKDPRFHFVLVCGAIGCPPLIGKAYLPATVEDQLETQTKLALNGDYFIKVDTKKKRIQGSEILKWYKDDFTMNGTTEIDFFNKYRTNKIPSSFKLSYFPYNWNINKQ